MAVLNRIMKALYPLSTNSMRPSISLVPYRTKSKQAKSQKARKDLRREMMKEFIKKQELEKLMQSASLKAAKMGEPFDPEMLNPARKRAPVQKSATEREKEFLLVKEWSRYRMDKHKLELKALGNMIACRDKALRELKKVSPLLHSRALELNGDLFPFECTGPSATPPIQGYTPPEPE